MGEISFRVFLKEAKIVRNMFFLFENYIIKIKEMPSKNQILQWDNDSKHISNV